jgi:DNA-binding PadR family transcriptional regulator
MSLRHALLALLAEQPHTGYDIGRRMHETVGLFWTAQHSQVYPELAKLVGDGLAGFESSAGPGPKKKKTYTITAAGRAALRDWLSEPAGRRVPRDELVLKAFASWVGDKQLMAEHYRAAADAGKDPLVRRKLALADSQRPEFGWYLSLQRGITAQRALRDWCEMVAAQLDRAAAMD